MLRFPCHQQDGVHNSGLQHNLYNDGQLDWGEGGCMGLRGLRRGIFLGPPNLIYPPTMLWPALIE